MIKNIIQEGFALKNKGYYKRAIEVFPTPRVPENK